MSITLYGVAGSPFVWRVQLALEYKALAYETTTIEMSKGENRLDWYLAMNPRGKVPVLKDGDTIIYESIAILSYLDRKYPESELFGSTSEQHALIMTLLMEQCSYMEPDTLQIVRPIFFGGIDEAYNDIIQATERAQQELLNLDALLDEQKWFAGNQMSAADVGLYPLLKIQERALEKPEAKPLKLSFSPFNDQYPNLLRWSQQIEALPYYQKTYPPHWNSS
ncbi:MAG TPA: glutathione S-transferase family protein [Thiotrichaceae bacterium]|jgi:glutathione S-transferase|nr:glutathione S-transferase family protein [Thiotrichaceae bacterium]HIM08058.1 glutathione S-transferase family protein [Gammaproteobacteria bacterium]